jgi:hypothetical protein
MWPGTRIPSHRAWPHMPCGGAAQPRMRHGIGRDTGGRRTVSGGQCRGCRTGGSHHRARRAQRRRAAGRPGGRRGQDGAQVDGLAGGEVGI